MKWNSLVLVSLSLFTFIQTASAEVTLQKNIDPALNITIDSHGKISRSRSPNIADKTNFSISTVVDNDGIVHSMRATTLNSETQNYFVEFDNDSLVSFRSSLNNQQAYQRSDSVRSQQEKKAKVSGYFQKIKTQQASFIQQVKKQFIDVVVIRQFNKTINSVVIKADKKTIEQIALYPNVKRIVKEKRFKKTLVESVPLINAPSVWQTKDSDGNFVKGDGVVVAIIDTGIDYTHPDLGGCLGAQCKVIGGWDFVNNDADPMDGDGHGTHVAGIVAGESDSYTGVAPNAKLYGIKVLSDDGWGSDSDIIAGIEYAVDPDGNPLTNDGVDIINMSLGGGGDANDPISIATNAAVDAGVIVVVAAGNDGYYGAINDSSPASAAKAITVASSTKKDDISSFSSKAILEEGVAIKPEITAPGSDIASSYLSHETDSFSGTSMAAPHVAGAIALLKQINPELTAQRAKELLSASAVDIGLDPLAQGAGRIDIFAALDVNTVISETVLNFGVLDKSSSSWTSSSVFTIRNLSEVEKTYQISLNESPIEYVEVTFDKTTITIPAGGEAEVNTTLLINDVISFPVSSNEAGTYYSDVIIRHDNHINRLPFAFQHANYLTLINDSNSDAYLTFTGVEQSREIPPVLLLANETKKIMFSSGSIFISTEFLDLSPADYLNSTYIDEDPLVKGITVHNINVQGDSEFIASLDSLQGVIGVNSIKNKQGSDLPLSDLKSQVATFTVDYNKDYNVTYYTHDANYYYVLGDIADGVNIVYGNLLTLDSPNNESDYYYYAWYESGKSSIEKAAFDIDFSSDEYFSVAFNDLLTTENSRINFDYNYAEVTVDTNTNKVSIYMNTSDEILSTGMVVSMIDKLPHEEYGYEEVLIARTGRLSLTSELTLNQFSYSLWNESKLLNTIPKRELQVNAAGTFWNGSIYTDENKISFFPKDFSPSKSFIADIRGFSYGDLNFHYKFMCDDEQLVSSSFITEQFNRAEITLPEEQCEKLTFSLAYDSYLNQSKYTSSMSFVVDSYLGIEQPLSITLYEGEQQVNDQIIDKIDARVELVFNRIDLYRTEYFIQLDGQAWQAVPYYVKDDTTVVLELGQITGAHIANLKIENEDYKGNKIVQTFNGFFNFGLDTGDEHDADSDGITNDADLDNDNDGVNDDDDLYPYNSLESADYDGDGIGNHADTDDDNDRVLDSDDAFPFDAWEFQDSDLDGIGNKSDTDDDNDGVVDVDDAFPLDHTEQYDTDFDGIGNNTDTDDDNDYVEDGNDALPLDASEQFDFDMDGIGDNADIDDDNDGVNDDNDTYPFDAAESRDTDGDGIGNNADTDDDNDGVEDSSDFYPLDASRSVESKVVPKVDTNSSSGGSASLFLIILLNIALWRKCKFQ